VKYFENELKYEKPKNFSDPDFLIDLIEKSSKIEKLNEKLLINGKFQEQSMFKKRNIIKMNEVNDFKHPSDNDNIQYVTSFFTQFYYLSKRTFKNFLFNPYLFPLQLIISILMGLFLGFVIYLFF
jgi:hypothetical protein